MGPEQVNVKESHGRYEMDEAHKGNCLAKGVRKGMKDLHCRLDEIYKLSVSISMVLKLVLSLLVYFEDAIKVLEPITEFILSEINSRLLFVVV